MITNDLTNVVRAMLFLTQCSPVSLKIELKSHFTDRSFSVCTLTKASTPIHSHRHMQIKLGSPQLGKNTMTSFYTPKTISKYIVSSSKPLEIKLTNTPQNKKETGFTDWGSAFSSGSSNSKGSSKFKPSRNHTNSVCEYIDKPEKVKMSPILQPLTLIKSTSDSADFCLPPLTRTEKMAMMVQKSVFSKIGVGKSKSKFGPAIQECGLSMLNTLKEPFIQKSAEKAKSPQQINYTTSHRKYKSDHKVVVLNTPNRIIFK